MLWRSTRTKSATEERTDVVRSEGQGMRDICRASQLLSTRHINGHTSDEIGIGGSQEADHPRLIFRLRETS